jgi:hypothetical protein
VCVPEPPARDIAMTAGPAVFNVLTAGAPPNSSITLRIDNRTTVTITVNADPAGSCPPGSSGAPPEPGTPPGEASGAPPGLTPAGVAGGIFEVPYWANLWASDRTHRARGGPLDGQFLNSLSPPPGPPFTGTGGTGTGGNGTGNTGTGGSGGTGYEGGGAAGTQSGGQGVALEPSTLVLLSSGLVALVFLARRRR